MHHGKEPLKIINPSKPWTPDDPNDSEDVKEAMHKIQEQTEAIENRGKPEPQKPNSLLEKQKQEIEAQLRKIAKCLNMSYEQLLKDINTINYLQPGPTGQHPEGKITPDDLGEIKIMVGIKQETVIINFGTEVAWVGLNANQAIDLGNMLLKTARRINKGG